MTRLLVDVHEAANMLGCGRTLVYQLMESGRLPKVKVGRLTRIPVEALEDFVADNATRASDNSAAAPGGERAWSR